ncbi:MAG: hypothetical protein AAF799_19000 [Myxococcota bacterium]
MTVRYALLHEIPGQSRARLRLHGPDTRRFLQGTLTADVESLREGQALAGALCTVKGKLVTEVVLLAGASEEEVFVLVPESLGDDIAQHFDKHIIMDEVEVESQGSVGLALAWSTDSEAPPAIEGQAGYVTRHPAPGRLLVGDDAELRGLLAAHEDAGVEGWNAHRVASASPAWGQEIEADFFPPEIGFVYAVSYDKGCFLGQEPLARIHARGQVNRVMVRVKAAAAPTEAVAIGTADKPNSGRWTTWASVDDGVQGLAIVRRAVAEAGTPLVSVGDSPIELEVVSGPLGDDPGVGNRKRSATVKLGGRR